MNPLPLEPNVAIDKIPGVCRVNPAIHRLALLGCVYSLGLTPEGMLSIPLAQGMVKCTLIKH